MPLFAGLPDELLDKLAEITKEHVLAQGEVLFEEGAAARSMHVIARGALSVLKRVGDDEVLLDVLGPGDIVGEMALLSGGPRQATVVAATAATLGEVSRADFQGLLKKSEELEELVHRAFVERRFDNHLRTLPRFAHLSHDDRMRWCRGGRMIVLEPEAGVTPTKTDRFVFVALGSARVGDDDVDAPALLEVSVGEDVVATTKCWVALLSSDASP